MRQMGVATSSVTFFRSMGGTIGASALGAVLTARLAFEFAHHVPKTSAAGGGGTASQLIESPQALNALKHANPALHEGIIQAYSHAIDRMFLVAVPVSILSIVVALFIKQVQLRGSDPVAGPVDAGTDGVS
jgi:Na+/melibiose symporter-like transporter